MAPPSLACASLKLESFKSKYEFSEYMEAPVNPFSFLNIQSLSYAFASFKYMEAPLAVYLEFTRLFSKRLLTIVASPKFSFIAAPNA